MIEKIKEKVSVNFIYNHQTGELSPRHIKWKNHVYTIEKVGLHYTKYQGKTLLHLFSVASGYRFFLLSFNTETLHWTLEETADDISN